MSMSIAQIGKLTSPETVLENILHTIRNTTHKDFEIPDVLFPLEMAKQIIQAILHNSQIIYVSSYFWKMPHADFLNLIEMLLSSPIKRRMGWDFMSMPDDITWDQWNSQYKNQFLENYRNEFALFVPGIIHSLSFPFALSTKEYQEWFEKFLNQYPRESYVIDRYLNYTLNAYNPLQCSQLREWHHEYREAMKLKEAMNEFLESTRSFSELNLSSILLNERNIKIVTEGLHEYSKDLRLQLTVDLSKTDEIRCIYTCLFAAIRKTKLYLSVNFKSHHEYPANIITFLTCLKINENLIQLYLTGDRNRNKIYHLPINRLQEISVFIANNFPSNTIKLWGDEEFEDACRTRPELLTWINQSRFEDQLQNLSKTALWARLDLSSIQLNTSNINLIASVIAQRIYTTELHLSIDLFASEEIFQQYRSLFQSLETADLAVKINLKNSIANVNTENIIKLLKCMETNLTLRINLSNNEMELLEIKVLDEIFNYVNDHFKSTIPHALWTQEAFDNECLMRPELETWYNTTTLKMKLKHCETSELTLNLSIVTENIVNLITEGLSESVNSINLTLKVDLSANESTFQHYTSLLKSIQNKRIDLHVIFKQPTDITTKNMIRFLKCLENIDRLYCLTFYSSKLYLLDIAILNEISEHMLTHIAYTKVSLWHDYDWHEIIKITGENQEKLLQYYKIYMLLTPFHLQPCPFPVNSQQYMNLFTEFNKLHPSKTRINELFHPTTTYNADTQKWDTSGYPIKAFNLSQQHLQDLFLMLCEKTDFDSDENEHHPFYSLSFDICKKFAAYGLDLSSPFFGAWKEYNSSLRSNNLDGLEYDSDDENKELADILKKKVLPALKRISLSTWGDKAFYKPCLDKIEAKGKQDTINDDEIALKKYEQLLLWYTWSNVQLTTLQIEVDLGKYKNIFREIVDYADETIRKVITRVFIDHVLKNKNGEKIYAQLILPKKEKASAIENITALIPALFLTQIINQSFENETLIHESKQNAEGRELTAMADDIIKSLPSQYKDGFYGQVFVVALHHIANAKDLTPHQKLRLLKNVLTTPSESKILEENLDKFLKSLKPSAQEKISSFTVRANISIQISNQKNGFVLLPNILDALSPYCKEDKLLDKRIFNALSRTIMDKLKEIHHAKALKKQREHWLLIQGLGLLQELSKLNAIPQGQFNTATQTILVDLFNLDPENSQLYETTFKGKRNEGALLTYLGKIRQLDPTSREHLLPLYQNFIRNLLTPNSKAFYDQRYDINLDCHKHLKTIWAEFPELKNRWLQNQSIDLIPFLHTHQITWKLFQPDYAKFVYTKIFEHQHLKPSDYPELKAYLEYERSTKETKEQKTIRQAEIKLQLETKKNPTLKAETDLQLTLIKLIELPAENKGAQLSCLREAKQHLRTLNGNEFLNDLRSLINGFKSTKKPLNLTQTHAYRIVFTDNPWDLFMCGTDVEGSCQRLDGFPDLNKCVISYLLSGKNKYLCIQDDNGKAIARCFIRLLWDQDSKTPVLYREAFYPDPLASEYQQALGKYVEILSDYMGIPVVSSESNEISKKYPNALVSLSGVGPEYVDALHDIMENGEFEIKNAQLLHEPLVRLPRQAFAPYYDSIENKPWSFLFKTSSCRIFDMLP